MMITIEGILNGRKIKVIWENGMISVEDPVLKRFIEIIFERYDGMEVDAGGVAHHHIRNAQSFITIMAKELQVIEDLVHIQ